MGLLSGHGRYYLKDGTTCDLMTWAEKVEDMEYRRIAKDVLPIGVVVSTVWLGLDHSFGRSGPPLIFETMVFDGEEQRRELDQERYATEEEARRGHARLVEQWNARGRVDP